MISLFTKSKEQDIARSLIEASQRGVRVRLILENVPYKHSFNIDETQDQLVPQLLSAGVQIIYGRPQYMIDQYPKGHYHARYMLIDNSRFVIITGNVDTTTFDHCRDFAIAFNKDVDTENINQNAIESLQLLFENDINNIPVDSIESPYIIISPEQGRNEIIQFLKKVSKFTLNTSMTQKSLTFLKKYALKKMSISKF